MYLSPFRQWLISVAYYFTYTEWAFWCWWHLGIGICLAYGRWYELTLPMYAFLGTSWFLAVLVIRSWGRNKRTRFIYGNRKNRLVYHGGQVHYSYIIGLILVALGMILLGYSRTEESIYAYKGRDMSYLKVPALYLVQVDSRPELFRRNGDIETRLKGSVIGLKDNTTTNITTTNNTDSTTNATNTTNTTNTNTINTINTNISKNTNADTNTINTINSSNNTGSANNTNIFKPASGTIQVYVKGEQEDILAGSYVLIKGTVQPSSVWPEEGRIDMRARHISAGQVGSIYDGECEGIVTADEVEALSGKALGLGSRLTNWIQRGLAHTHKEASAILQQYLPEELSHLSESLLLGGGYGVLDEMVIGAFSKTGLIHILSVSGSHIALLFGFVFFLGRICKISSIKATYSAIVIVILYCALVGYNPPVVRSALMGIVMGLGLIMKKEYAGLQALHISAWCLLYYDPLQLFDISFQLSFGATYGIILFARPLYQSLPKGMPYIMGPISLCISAQLLILPLQLYYFHILGFGSLLAAIIVAPLLDLAIIGILALLLITSILTVLGLGSLVGWCWSLLALVLQLALFLNETIAMMPGMVYWSAALSLGRWLLYSMLLYGLYYSMKYVARRRFIHEYMLYLSLVFLLCSANIGLWEAGAIQIHTVPLSRGAGIIVLRKEYFSKPTAVVYMELNKKDLSSYSRASIVNACHYYGITKPEAIIFKDSPHLDGSILAKGKIYSLYSEDYSDITGPTQEVNTQEVNVLRPGADLSEEVKLVSDLKCSKARITQLKSQVWQVGETAQLDDVLLEKTDVLHVVGMTKSYLFSHRQTGKKTLKLDEDKLIILGTADPGWLLKMEEFPFVEALVFSPSYGGREIDPADDKVYMTGAYIIPDFLL